MVAGVCFVAPVPALAAPTLQAGIAWRGECEDPQALREEVHARGAELIEVTADEHTLSLSVAVERVAPEQLRADIELTASGSQERRRVDARECVALRRAIAWVLGVLAEEREAAAREAPEHANGEFPAPPALPPPTSPVAPEPKRRASAAPTAAPAQPPSPPCAHPAPHFQLSTELVAGLGLVDSAALGPALMARYRPCTRGWPGFSLGAVHLQSLGYDLDTRSIALQRTNAQLGAWLPIGPLPLRGGLVVEAGRIHVSGAGTGDGPGRSSGAPWFAIVTPWRWSLPLLGRSLSVELGLDVAYTPLSYRLRYASQLRPLAEPSHFELRGALGVAGHF